MEVLQPVILGAGVQLGQAGEAFFVEPTDGPVARELLSSPLPRREHRKQTSGSDQEESKLGSPTAALTAANLAQRSRSFSATRKDEPIASKEPEHDLHSLQQPVLGRRRSQSVGELKQSEPTVTTTTTVQSPQHVRAEPVNHWWSWKWGSLPVLKDREEEETGGNQLERVDSLAASDVADAVDQSKPAYLHSNGIAMSLCADVLATIGADAATMERVFVDNIVSREAFDHSRFAITDDQRLVVCIAGVLLPWKLAASLLLARTAFQIELTKALVQQWAADYRETQSGPVPNWFALELTGGELRSDSPSVASALVESEQKPASGNNGESIQIAVPISPAESVTNDQESLSGYPISPHSPLLSDADPNNSSRLLSVDEDKPVGDEQRLGELRIDVQSDTASEAEDEEEEEELLVHDIPLDEISPEPARGFDSDTESVTGSIDGDGGKKYRYRKTLVPSSEMLQGMGLRHGSNEIEFVLDGANTSVTARIFLWPSDAKVIVTDVDGPIVTRSNMLANFIPVKSRYHAGVVELFSNIQQNGYHILYLATKSLTQISSTKVSIISAHEPALSFVCAHSPFCCARHAGRAGERVTQRHATATGSRVPAAGFSVSDVRRGARRRVQVGGAARRSQPVSLGPQPVLRGLWHEGLRHGGVQASRLPGRPHLPRERQRPGPQPEPHLQQDVHEPQRFAARDLPCIC